MTAHPPGQDSALGAHGVLDALTAQQAALLTLMDRTRALRAVSDRTREEAGMDISLVGQLEGDHGMVLRTTSGLRTPSLVDLVVPSGLGLGGRVLATGRPAWVDDYASSPAITHHFDTQVAQEDLHAMMAVPVVLEGGVQAVLYGAVRTRTSFGDTTIELVQDLAAQAARAIELCAKVEGHTQAAVTADRQRISLALHDSVGAMLFGIGAQLRDLRADAAPDLRARLAMIENQIAAAGSALRESLAALSPAAPEEELSAAVVRDCEAFQERTGIFARGLVLGDLPATEASCADLLRQTARECLLNVEKHARAGSVLVSLSPAANGITLAVVDDGIGLTGPSACAPEHSSGLGLRALADRLEQRGGHLTVVENEDAGLTVRAWCPVG